MAGRILRRFVCALLLVTGCGPGSYLVVVASGATRAVSKAKAANAEKLAPYEYWSATEYLKMAREVGTYANYDLAWNYGKKAENMAHQAEKKAFERSRSAPNGGSVETGENGSPATLHQR
ncbi:MAG: DUF4398 domain-containing protein [Pseudomonadota bacterium]